MDSNFHYMDSNYIFEIYCSISSVLVHLDDEISDFTGTVRNLLNSTALIIILISNQMAKEIRG